jgi:hypothetical protein
VRQPATVINIGKFNISAITVIQELGREDMIPFASIFASNKPFNAPMAGLFQQAFISCLAAVLPPPGDAYQFVLNGMSCPRSLLNDIDSLT